MPGNITYGKPSYKNKSFVLDPRLFDCRAALVQVAGPRLHNYAGFMQLAPACRMESNWRADNLIQQIKLYPPDSTDITSFVGMSGLLFMFLHAIV